MDASTNYHKNLKDLAGQRFGRLEVLRRESEPGAVVRWLCRCDCGAEKAVRASKLSTGNTVSCGCHVAEQRRLFNLSRNDFTGKVFGRLTVLERVTDGPMRWRCACSCGGEKLATTNYLKTSGVPSCGCAEREATAARRFVDLTGQRFGKLVVASHAGFDERRKSMWRCVCDCGGERVTRGNTLKSGRAISCGCAAQDDQVYMPKHALQQSSAKCAVRRARKRGAGGSFTPEELEAVFAKQRYRCANCGVKAKLVGDHKIALAKGGANDISNMEGLCSPCNHRKNAKDEIAWAQDNGRLL